MIFVCSLLCRLSFHGRVAAGAIASAGSRPWGCGRGGGRGHLPGSSGGTAVWESQEKPKSFSQPAVTYTHIVL